ncbi:MAG: hypothetical protein ACEPOZ_09775 [Marinifilaceae bacterium]
MSLKPARMGIFRVFLYALPIAFAAQIIFLDASRSVDTYKFTEASYTEWMQAVCLLLTSLLFLWTGWLESNRRAFAFLMSGGALMAAIREFDWWFDAIYHGAWLPFAMVVLLIVLWGIFKNRSQFAVNLDEFFKTRASGAFLTGFLTVFVFSRLFGRKIVWRALFEVEKLEPLQRGVKNASEEGVELLGYVLLLISGVEYWIYVNRVRKQRLGANRSKEA